MSSVAKLCAALAALVLAATLLAGCTSTTTPEAVDASPKSAASQSPQPEPSATPNTPEADADACTSSASIHIGAMSARVNGTLVDRGARYLAEGTVALDDEGNIVSYTVAPGDAPDAIGARLCIENAAWLGPLNHTRTIHPDQVLRFDRDPAVPWVPYYNPVDAPEGFQQIPYQYAIEAMAAAADADDVDAMRAIWANGLSAMFSTPKHIEVIQQALDAGDLNVLRQMFS